MKFKLLGYTVNLSKKPAPSKQKAVEPGKGRPTGAIRKQAKREVSFQIEDIKRGIQMARNPDMPDRTRLHEIYDYILRDGRLKSQLRTARIKVLSEP